MQIPEKQWQRPLPQCVYRKPQSPMLRRGLLLVAVLAVHLLMTTGKRRIILGKKLGSRAYSFSAAKPFSSSRMLMTGNSCCILTTGKCRRACVSKAGQREVLQKSSSSDVFFSTTNNAMESSSSKTYAASAGAAPPVSSGFCRSHHSHSNLKGTTTPSLMNVTDKCTSFRDMTKGECSVSFGM